MSHGKIVLYCVIYLVLHNSEGFDMSYKNRDISMPMWAVYVGDASVRDVFGAPCLCSVFAY